MRINFFLQVGSWKLELNAQKLKTQKLENQEIYEGL